MSWPQAFAASVSFMSLAAVMIAFFYFEYKRKN